jgi:hypothetical protein
MKDNALFDFAMAEGLMHKPLTIKQLLCIRPIIIIP